jgi:transposase
MALYYNRLVKECGYSGSRSTIYVNVRKLKEDMNIVSKEAFIPSDPEKRKGAEADWGEAYVWIKGERTLVYFFCMRSKYSGKTFARFYPTTTQEAFLDAHIRAFGYFGGIFSEIIYDNLKAAVYKILKGRNRIEQESFISFRSYYNYEAKFCNAYKGSEKGGVEGVVGFVKHNFLTPQPQGDNLEEINDLLYQQCLTKDATVTHGQTVTIGELFEKEKINLITTPKRPYSNYKLITGIVDKYLTVMVDTNRYSVPYGYRSKEVLVEKGVFDIKITYNNKLIGTHKREFSRGQWVLNPWDYLEVLERKPQALEGSRIITKIEKDWDPTINELYLMQIQKYGQIEGSKEFISTLLMFKEKDLSETITVIQLSIENKAFSKESIALVYETLNEKTIYFEEAKISHIKEIAAFTLPEVNVYKFDKLMEVACGM